MSGFTGKTKTISGTPEEIMPLRKKTAGYLEGQDFGSLNTGAPDMTPFLKMFQDQNANTFALAKEQAGNLTGSGYGNAVGDALGKASTEQGAFLASMAEKSKQDNANRFAQLLASLTGSGVAPPQTGYQPGFLDYLAQAGSSVGTALAGRPRK